ncbi:MAG: hypothetical protein HZC42_12495 [Candidatus Eisenbacteria bacterium]|nr:hypothetical protein [Candidatus Eisenbacteria bacterium]
MLSEPGSAPPPSLEEVESRMRPGALSRTGFLAPGERLRDVLDDDARALDELGVPARTLAGRLEALIRLAALDPLGWVRLEGRLEVGCDLRPCAVEGAFEARIEPRLGYQVCPWSWDVERPHACRPDRVYAYSDLDWTVRNLCSGEEMSGPGLIVHLIREHGFFEGPGSPSRVDPRTLARVLELAPHGG